MIHKFEQFLIDTCGYKDVEIKDTKYYAIAPLIFTHAIIAGKIDDTSGYDDRWCYHSYDDAYKAITAWSANNYEGEPDGWHRHPSSGRRRDETGNETIRY